MTVVVSVEMSKVDLVDPFEVDESLLAKDEYASIYLRQRRRKRRI
eukprot:CAMPEP_0198285178 /NCGR_PEP_ID=MMETSP1449-20131203/4493_1 /TAXON_ID=420275 /ORGANISM="Attheya septentrionalis, Strain CCMP2084" /LENGTH=44 /DNA_ID= /DNA_START= /DNA_END= /DNA_ORIENTATION=